MDDNAHPVQKFKTQHLHCHVYVHTWPDSTHEYKVEVFYWWKRTKRAQFTKLHGIARSHFEEMAQLWESAEEWCRKHPLPRERRRGSKAA